MKKNYLLQFILVLIVVMSSLFARSQSFTISTWQYPDTLGGNYQYGQLHAVICFNIENTNDTPIILTQVEMIMNYAAFFSGTVPTLWYSSTSLGGPATIEEPAGWIPISTGVPVSVIAYGYYPLFQNLFFTIPAHTQYRFALESTNGFREDPSNPYNSYENNGIIFRVGDAHSEVGLLDTVGYTGVMPNLDFSPGFFAGRITLEPASTTPVTLLNLTAAYNKNSHNNIINWQTAQEINSSHFLLQKSYNATRFSNVATIPAAGNSSIQKNYTYTDNDIQYKPTYYRLQQTDKDGRYTYSKTVQVNPVKNSSGISIHPSPAQNNITVQYQSANNNYSTIIITDMQGRQLQKNVAPCVSGNNQSLINIASLAAGKYVLTVYSGGQVLQSSFVKE